MYYVSAQGVDERMINVHYYYVYKPACNILSPFELPEFLEGHSSCCHPV